MKKRKWEPRHQWVRTLFQHTNWRCLWLIAWVFLAQAILAQTPEEIAFNAASRAFQENLFEKADKDLGEWVKAFPKSERLSQALLLQAQARFKLGQHGNVVALLTTQFGSAGKQADQFRYWIAEAQFAQGDYSSAASSYEQLLKDYPDSSLRSQASYGEALSRFRSGNAKSTVDLLSNTNSILFKVGQAQPNDEYVFRGQILLAEACLALNDQAKAQTTLNALQDRPLPPLLNWQRQYLLAKMWLAQNNADEASKNMTNLVQAALATASPACQSDTAMLQGQIFEALGQHASAIQVYEQNLASLPPQQRRQALLKLAEWHQLTGHRADAIKNLEQFLEQQPSDTDKQQVMLAVGELHLKEYFQQKEAAASTNRQENLAAAQAALLKAQTMFDTLVTNAPLGRFSGLAQLNRGWCFWESGHFAESAEAFAKAASQVEPGTNQVIALSKRADALFELKDYAGSRTNYSLALVQSTNLTGLAPGWIERNYYQLIRSSLELSDLPSALTALGSLTTQHAQGAYVDQALLLVGQTLNHNGRPAEARGLLNDLIQKHPNSGLLPEARIALAQSWVLESKWQEALTQMDAWILQYTNHPQLPQVEYDRAWVVEKTGDVGRSIQLYTNFVTRFEKSSLAPLAQNAVANHFYNIGQFAEAERNYQILYQNTNWPGGDLAYRARFWAGRAAFSRQGFSDATNYFVSLINLLNNTSNAPVEMLPSVYFALGDTYAAMPSTDTTNALKKFGEAIVIFGRIPDTNVLAPHAWGRIADCHLQLATQDPGRYTNALQFYQKVVDSNTVAHISERSQAQVGLAIVQEGLAKLMPQNQQSTNVARALDLYLDVFLEKNLQPGETADAFWVARSGMEAIRLLEAQSRWNEMIGVCERLGKIMPNLKASLDKKIEAARKKL